MANTKKILKIVLLFSIFTLIGCGSGPDDAYKEIVDGIKEKNWSYVYDNLDSSTKQSLERQVRILVGREKAKKRSPEAIKERNLKAGYTADSKVLESEMNQILRMETLKDQELFAFVAENLPQVKSALRDTDFEVIEVKEVEGKAKLVVIHEGRTKETVYLMKEDDKWKLRLRLQIFNPSKFLSRDKATGRERK